MKKFCIVFIVLAALLLVCGTAGAFFIWTDRPTGTVCPCCGATMEVTSRTYQDVVEDHSYTEDATEYDCTNCCYNSRWGDSGSQEGCAIFANGCTGGTATCTDRARCSNCGKSYGSTDPDNHDFVNVAEKKATCTAAGYTAHKKCSRCGAKDGYGEIPALGHDFSVNVAEKKATCTAAGYTAHKKCSRCGAKDGYKEIPAAGHTPVTDPAAEPTCTNPGLTEGSHCTVCGAVLKAQEKIPALDHLFIAWYPDGRGNHIMTCKRKCGYQDTQKCNMFILPQADPDAAEVSFCPICGWCIGAKMTAVKGLKPLDGAPHGSLRVFSLEAGEKKYMTIAFDYSLTGELLQPTGEVTFSLPDELKDAAITTVDAEGVEWPVEKIMEGNTRILKLNFTPDGKAPVKVIVLNVVDE